jgi:RNA polymerase sigma factor (sigma-70 family)
LHDAADVTQETWLAAHSAFPKLATFSYKDIEGWLKKTARHKAFNLLRESRTGRRPGCRLLYLEEVEDFREPEARDPPPDHETVTNEETALLRIAMAELESRRAALLSLLFLRGLPIREVAAILRISRYTARRERQLAIEELRRAFLVPKRP